MSRKPIEQQVAELTPEQKNNMGKIYKKYSISIVSILLIFFILVIAMFAYASSKEKQAKTRADMILENNIFSSYDEREELLEEYYDAKQLKPLTLIVGGGVSLAAIVVVCLIIQRKYPYFSEQKYKYLKKMEKAKVQENK